MNDQPESPVKIDIAAKAEARFELKGEVPTSAVGRLAHALADAISPLTESRGLRGDALRLQREDVLCEIANRAQKRLLIEHLEPRPIPVKTLVPLLEKASLEDPNSDLVDWWASLLAKTSTDERLHHPVFTDVMSKITSPEAKLLNHILTVSDDTLVGGPDTDLDDLFISHVVDRASDWLAENKPQDPDHYSLSAQKWFEAFRVEVERRKSIVTSILFPASNLRMIRNPNQEFGSTGRTFRELIDVLAAVGIMNRIAVRYPVPSPFVGEFSCNIEVVLLTAMGQRLVEVCGRPAMRNREND